MYYTRLYRGLGHPLMACRGFIGFFGGTWKRKWKLLFRAEACGFRVWVCRLRLCSDLGQGGL